MISYTGVFTLPLIELLIPPWHLMTKAIPCRYIYIYYILLGGCDQLLLVIRQGDTIFVFINIPSIYLYIYMMM